MKKMIFIKSWEKLELEAYDDAEGFATVGYGHLIGRYGVNEIPSSSEFANDISEERAEALLKTDLSGAEETLKGTVSVHLHQHEYDALVSLIYNMGSPSRAPKLFSFLNDEKYDDAANEFADITNNGLPGLVTRRQDEISIFKNNIYNNHN